MHFIGAGPGDPELLTVKGKRVLEEAEVVVYAGSLINPKILDYAKKDAELYDSAGMTFEEIIDILVKSSKKGKVVARLHSGDPSIYGAIAEQIEALEEKGVPCKIIPGVSSLFAAAASMAKEYTVPGGSQSVIITRLSGRTPVPESEDLDALAKHRSSMGIFLSTHMIEDAMGKLKESYGGDMPAAVVYRASWDDEKIIEGTLDDIAEKVKAQGVKKTALILVGDFLRSKAGRSKLYSRDFEHGFRKKESEG
ncbi:MAG: precorrin-4 C(11)-methyltransferase [Candidatus Hydrothermarchaeales archaeon]